METTHSHGRYEEGIVQAEGADHKKNRKVRVKLLPFAKIAHDLDKSLGIPIQRARSKLIGPHRSQRRHYHDERCRIDKERSGSSPGFDQ